MKELLQPIEIGGLKLNNRLVMPPLATYLATPEGQVTEPLLDYYDQRARGGEIGLIFTEHSFISRQGQAKAKQLSIASDDDVAGLKRLTDVIHQAGAKAFAQLNHAGSAAVTADSGLPAVSASPVPLPVTPALGDGNLPEEASAEQIGRITGEFAAAAKRAKLAGYDGVEIHCAHGYLLNQFYSPLTNRRTDAYGGGLENRMRFLLEAVAAVRKAVGDFYPISVRLGGCDYMEGGSTIDDAVRASALLERAGVDLLSLSGGMCRFTRPGHTEAGYFGDMSGAVRRNVSIPVLIAGGVKTAEEAEQLLDAGLADLIGVGRALMKDPRWAEKALASLA